MVRTWPSFLIEKGCDKATGRSLVEVDPKYFRPAEVDQLLGDPSKAKAKLGWNPQKTSFPQLVKLIQKTQITIKTDRKMKKAIALFAALLLTTAAGFAQKINVHKTDGTTVTIPLSSVDYIDFTAAGETGNAPEGVEAVDLGLPSGTKWANMNVGATSPEDYGDYFRWGETKPFVEGDTQKTYPYMGVDLGESIAGSQYDAATANWGASWKMPTVEQLQELMHNCTYTWTTQNGVNGGKVTEPNGASIFFPASGCRGYSSGSLYGVGSYGYCWSASAYNSYSGRGLGFYSSYWDWYNDNRANGFPVRAVAE